MSAALALVVVVGLFELLAGLAVAGGMLLLAALGPGPASLGRQSGR